MGSEQVSGSLAGASCLILLERCSSAGQSGTNATLKLHVRSPGSTESKVLLAPAPYRPRSRGAKRKLRSDSSGGSYYYQRWDLPQDIRQTCIIKTKATPGTATCSSKTRYLHIYTPETCCHAGICQKRDILIFHIELGVMHYNNRFYFV